MLHQRHEATPLPKVIRETQAEAVTYVVSHAVGLETNNAAADYITLYNGDKKTLARIRLRPFKRPHRKFSMNCFLKRACPHSNNERRV
jgi:hypothetical protein